MKYSRKYISLCQSLILSCLFFVCACAYSEDITHNVIIVYDSKIGIYARFINKLDEDLRKGNTGIIIKTISTQQLSNSAPLINQKITNIYVSVGINSAEAISSYREKKILSLMPLGIFNEKYKNDTNKCPADSCKAVILDQPIDRQLKGIHLLLPRTKNILVLTDDNSKTSFQAYKVYAKSLGMNIILKTVNSPDYLAQQLKELLPSCDVLLTTPNSRIYNSTTARTILLSAYKYGVPIFAHSQSFIDAGAVAGIYSTPEQHAKYTAELVLDGLSNFNNSKYQVFSPKYFTLNANFSVAESLNIQVPDISKVHKLLEKQQ